MDSCSFLKKREWQVLPVKLFIARALVEKYHYAKSAANTATYLHGLFKKQAGPFDGECFGVAWWIPPTKSAARATFPDNWRGVLSLSRLVVHPDVPKNGASFLLGSSRALIDRKIWPILVTYADEWQGHMGTIYRADNWRFIGKTKPEAVWVKGGRMISRKAGPKTRTKQQMELLGASMVGRFSKRKFVHGGGR